MIFVPQYKPYKGVMLCFVPGAADRVAQLLPLRSDVFIQKHFYQCQRAKISRELDRNPQSSVRQQDYQHTHSRLLHYAEVQQVSVNDSQRCSLMAQWVKNPLVMQETQETQVQSLGWEDPLPKGGHGNPLQYSCLKQSHGQRSPGAHGLQGCKESYTTGHTSTRGKHLPTQ